MLCRMMSKTHLSAVCRFKISDNGNSNLAWLIRVSLPLLSAVVSQPAASSPTPVASSSSEENKGDTPKPKKNRCFMCRKRVGLTGEWGGLKGQLMQHIITVGDDCFTVRWVFLAPVLCSSWPLLFQLWPLTFVPPGFDCRCGNLFCGIHRYSDKHNCPYDYKAEAAAKIRKENPVVVADKIQRI